MSIDVAAEKKKLTAFLQKHDPEKVNLVDVLLKKFVPDGPEGLKKMWDSLEKRYGAKADAAPSASRKDSKVAAAADKKGPASPTKTTKASPKAKEDAKPPAASKGATETSESPRSSSKPKTPKITAEPKSESEKGKEAPSPKKKSISSEKEKPQAATTNSKPQAATANSKPQAATANSKPTAGDDATFVQQQRARLVRYFQKYMPERVPAIDAIVQKMSQSGKREEWDRMWSTFHNKFGPEEPDPSDDTGGADKEASDDDNENTSASRTQENPPNAVPRSSGLPPNIMPQRLAPALSVPSLSSPSTPSSPPTTSVPARRDVVEADLARGGSMTIREDQELKEKRRELLVQQWQERISRYLSHYDSTRPHPVAEIETAVRRAMDAPEGGGVEQMWATLLEHYGPEPPQTLSSMMRFFQANSSAAATPEVLAKGLINGGTSTVPGTLHQATHVGASVSTTQQDAAAVSAPKKKAWYMEDDTEPAPHSSATPQQRPAASLSNTRSSNLQRSTVASVDDVIREGVHGVHARATALFGVLRLVGVDYERFRAAPERNRYQFIRAMEQEISYNANCDPACVTVRRIVPNVAVDFKLDLSEAADVVGSADPKQSARRIGDVLVNRVLNGTFTLRLIRDSYRRDIGGSPSDVFTQSCAVFGSEAQQFYTLVPDPQSDPGLTLERSVSGAPYAAVAASPPSRDMHPKDRFGTVPPAGYSTSYSVPSYSNPRSRHTPPTEAVDRFVEHLHTLAEQDRAGVGVRQAADHVRRPIDEQVAFGDSAAADRRGGLPTSVGGDFTTHMWDDATSDLPEYERRDETSRYAMDKPAAISGTLGWNRLLANYADPTRNAAAYHGLRGAQNVPEPQPYSASDILRRREEIFGTPPSQMPLKGLRKVSPSPTRPQQRVSPSPVRDNMGSRDTIGSRSGVRNGPVYQPTSILEPPIGSSPHRSSASPRHRDAGSPKYTGFGRDVPAIASQAKAHYRRPLPEAHLQQRDQQRVWDTLADHWVSGGRRDTTAAKQNYHQPSYMEGAGRRLQALPVATGAGFSGASRSSGDGFSRALQSVYDSSHY